VKKILLTAAAVMILCLFLPRIGFSGCTEGDCKNGIGTWVWDNENAYHGSFKNGKRTGHGDYTFSNGDTYSGDFLDGKFNGHGKYTYADGDVYDGQWANGKMAGKGELQRRDGSKQAGDYRDGAIVEKWNDDTEELKASDSNKYPRGHIEKLMADPPDKKAATKQPVKK
jgi:hypothetical protein